LAYGRSTCAELASRVGTEDSSHLWGSRGSSRRSNAALVAGFLPSPSPWQKRSTTARRS